MQAVGAMTKEKSGASWTNEEMRSSVSAYLDMARHVRLGKPINKRAVYQLLAAEFGRTPRHFLNTECRISPMF